MADSIGETPGSAFPEGVGSALNGLVRETGQIKLNIKELTDTLKEQTVKQEDSLNSLDNKNKAMLDCLQDMRAHLNALVALQRESIISSEEEKRRKEPDIPDVGSIPSAKAAAKGEGSSTVASGKVGSSFAEVGKGIFFIAASIGALGLGLKLMKDVKLTEIVKAFVMIAALGTGLLIFSKLGSGENMKKTALSLIVLAGGIAAIALSLLLMHKVSWASITKGVSTIAMFGIVMAFVNLIGKDLWKTAAALIVLGGALIALSFGLNLFAKVTWSSIIKGTIALAVLAGTFGVISLLFGGDRMVKSAKGLLIFTAALGLFAGVLLLMNFVKWTSIMKLFTGIILILPVLTIMMLIMAPAVLLLGLALWVATYAFNKFAEACGNIAKSLLVFALAIYVLQSAVKGMTWENVGMIFTLVVGFAALLLGLQYALDKMGGGKTLWKTAFAIAMFSVSLVLLTAALIGMKLVDWQSMGKAAAVLAAFAGFSKAVDGSSFMKAGLGMLGLGLGMLSLGAALLLFKMVDLQTIGVAALALLAIGGAAVIISKFGVGPFIKTSAGIILLGIGLITLGAGLLMFKAVDLETIKRTGIALLVLGGASLIVSKLGVGPFIKTSAGIILLGIGLISLAAGLLLFKAVDEGTIKVAAFAMLVLGGSAFLIGKLGFSVIMKGALALGAVGVALGVAAIGLAIMSEISKDTIGIAGLAILVLGGSAFIIGKLGFSEILKGALGIAALGAALFPLAIGLSIMEEVTMETIGVTAAAILLLGTAAFLIGSFGLGPILMGALGLAALGIALFPLAIGLNMMSEIKLETVGILALSILALGLLAAGLGLIAPLIFTGALAILALGIALIPLALGLQMINEISPETIGAMGMAFLKLAGGLSVFALATPLVIVAAVGIVVLAIAMFVLGVAMEVCGDHLEAFNKTLEVFGNQGVKMINAVGEIFKTINTIIRTTGSVIGELIDKIVELSDPSMGASLFLTSTGILAVASALGTLLAVGAATGLVSGAATAVGGILSGIGNFFSGAKGGALNAVQTLALIVQAAEYSTEISAMSSEIEKLAAALNSLAQSPPISSEVLSQMDILIQKAQKLSELQKGGFWDSLMNIFSYGTFSKVKGKFSGGVGVEGELNPQPLNIKTADYATLYNAAQLEREQLNYGGGREWAMHAKLLQEILQELKVRDGLREEMSRIGGANIAAPITNISGGGGGGMTFIPITTSSNRESTWKATQGSYRPAG